MKMPKVTRAFLPDAEDVEPRDGPDDRQDEPCWVAGPRGRNAVPLITALTVEMQAVRM